MSLYLASYLPLLGWTLIPIAAGVLLRRSGVPGRASRYLFLFALFACQMPIVLLATWAARISRSSWPLPFLVLAGWLAAAGVARWVSGRMNHPPRRRGAFIVSMCMSNHGYTLLGLVAMVLFGDAGLSQATYAQLMIVPFLVLVCFPLGRFYGEGQGRVPLRTIMLKCLADPRSLPMAAMLAGVVLNLSGLDRPGSCERVVAWFVYTGTIVSGLAMGLLFRGLFLKRFFRENVFSFLYRLTAYPLMYFGMAAAAGLAGLDVKIIVLFGLVPSALFASLVAEFFGLDTDLTSSVFVVGTLLFLLAVLPVYALVVLRI